MHVVNVETRVSSSERHGVVLSCLLSSSHHRVALLLVCTNTSGRLVLQRKTDGAAKHAGSRVMTRPVLTCIDACICTCTCTATTLDDGQNHPWQFIKMQQAYSRFVRVSGPKQNHRTGGLTISRQEHQLMIGLVRESRGHGQGPRMFESGRGFNARLFVIFSHLDCLSFPPYQTIDQQRFPRGKHADFSVCALGLVQHSANIILRPCNRTREQCTSSFMHQL